MCIKALASYTLNMCGGVFPVCLMNGAVELAPILRSCHTLTSAARVLEKYHVVKRDCAIIKKPLANLCVDCAETEKYKKSSRGAYEEKDLWPNSKYVLKLFSKRIKTCSC
jgi:hypothetical protein